MKSFVSRFASIDKEIKNAIIVLIVLLIIGTTFYTVSERWSVLDSLYFSVITLTTVGYGEMHPSSSISKVFSIAYILFGVGLVFYIFTSVASHMFADEKNEIRNLEHSIEKLEKQLIELKRKRTSTVN